MQKRNQTKGFVLVATKRLSFFKAGCYLAETILDHMPDAKITLFTEQQFIDDSSLQKDLSPFDKVLPTISNTNREKMYGMANTPYDITMYLDVDMEITDEDIVTIWDQLEDNDLKFVNLTREGAKHFAEWHWGPNHLDDGWQGVPDHLSHCGGVCLYRSSNPLTLEFMQDWYDLFLKQRIGEWSPKEFDYIKIGNFRQWDQLTLWWLIYHSPKYKKLKWSFFKENYRWNYYTSFGLPWTPKNPYCDKHPIVTHYSSGLDKYGKRGILTL